MEEYDKYLDQIDLFVAYFATATQPLNVEITYNVKPWKDPSEYNIIISIVTVLRTDNENLVYEFSTKNTSELSQAYYFKPAIDISKYINSSYDEELVIVAKNKQKEMIIIAKNKQKEILLEKKRILWKDPVTNFRYGIMYNFGFAFQEEKFGYQMSISGYYPLSNNFYVGVALDGSFIIGELIESEFYYSDEVFNYTIGLYPLIGLVFPNRDSSGLVTKPFVDLRFGINEIGELVTLINGGIMLSEVLEGQNFTLEFATQIQLSGKNQGLWSLSVGLDLFAMLQEL